MYSILPLVSILLVYFGSALAQSPFPADLTLWIWGKPGCNQSDSVSRVTTMESNELQYSVFWPYDWPVMSYQLSRDLHPWEHLDWSDTYFIGQYPEGGQIPKACGRYLQTTNPDSNDHTLAEGICYPITGNPACVNIINMTCPPTYDYQTGAVTICET